MGGQAASPAKDILLDSCDDRGEAGRRTMAWAALLVKLRVQDTHGVRMSVIPGAWAWGIYLHERTPGKRTARIAQLEARLHRMETGQRAS